MQLQFGNFSELVGIHFWGMVRGLSDQSGARLRASGHYSRDWSKYVNVIGVINEPFVVNEHSA